MDDTMETLGTEKPKGTKETKETKKPQTLVRTVGFDPSDSAIREDSWVFLQLPSGNSKSVLLRRGLTISLGKFGSFRSDLLIGCHYLVPYEIVVGNPGGLRRVKNINIMEDFDLGDTEVDASNKTIVDDPSSQKLSQSEIEELKSQSLKGLVNHDSLIQKIVENNAAFEKKTDFAKIKYIKRKQKKYSKIFTPLRPSARLFCDHYLSKSPEKSRGIRIDTLSQMLSLSNVHAGGRFLVVDDIHGLLVSSMIERMHEWGEIVVFHDKSHANIDLMRKLNFPPSFLDIVSTLPWSLLENEPKKPEEGDDSDQYAAASYARATAKYDQIQQLRTRLLEGGYDGLLVASRYDAKQIVQKLGPLLGRSKPLVVYAPYKESLHDGYNYVRTSRAFVNTQLTESWLREYQVPVHGTGTHPMMTTTGSGGYMFAATTIEEVAETEGEKCKRVRGGPQRPAKRARVDAANSSKDPSTNPSKDPSTSSSANPMVDSSASSSQLQSQLPTDATPEIATAAAAASE